MRKLNTLGEVDNALQEGAITLHANWRVPIRDWSSCKVADFLLVH